MTHCRSEPARTGKNGASRLFLVIFWVIGAFFVVANAVAQTVCLTNSDTAATYVQRITLGVNQVDSATLAAQGIPYKPNPGPALVTSDSTCQVFVDAFNAALPQADSGRRISRAYVVRVGTVHVLIGEHIRSVFYYFDAQHNIIAVTYQLSRSKFEAKREDADA